MSIYMSTYAPPHSFTNSYHTIIIIIYYAYFHLGFRCPIIDPPSHTLPTISTYEFDGAYSKRVAFEHSIGTVTVNSSVPACCV
jgi:hypothetical protein